MAFFDKPISAYQINVYYSSKKFIKQNFRFSFGPGKSAEENYGTLEEDSDIRQINQGQDFIL